MWAASERPFGPACKDQSTICKPCVDHPDGQCPRHKRNGGCNRKYHGKRYFLRCPVSCGVCQKGSAYIDAGRPNDPVAIDCNDRRAYAKVRGWGTVCMKSCGNCAKFGKTGLVTVGGNQIDCNATQWGGWGHRCMKACGNCAKYEGAVTVGGKHGI